MSGGDIQPLLGLLRHRDPDVRAQGIELLRSLPSTLRQDAYARAAEAGDANLCALISGGGDPVLTGWHLRRAWSAAACAVLDAHTKTGAPLPPTYRDHLTELDAILSGPPTAHSRVAVGRIRLWLEGARRETPRPPARAWSPPAHVLFYAPSDVELTATQALSSYQDMIREQVCVLTRRQLRFLSPPDALLYMRAASLVRLRLGTEALAELERQALLRADGAPVTTQRALFERLDSAQRTRADAMQRAQQPELEARWSQTLRDLGAAADSAVFQK